MKEYLLTDEQKDMQALFRDFAAKEVAPISAEYDRRGECPVEVLKKAADIGLTTGWLPEKYGGAGFDYLTGTLLGEELGKADAGFSVAVGACELAGIPVLMGKNEKQIQKMADVLLQGGMSAFCLTEASAGSDVVSLRTQAVKDGNDYIINGVKTFITNGGIADLYTVFATVDPSLGPKGVAAFMVERERAGVSAGKEEDKMGIRLSNTSEVIFEDVRVPAENMIGSAGQGLAFALGTLDRTRGAGSATAVGICQHALDYALDYAKTRVTFGKPIIANQAIQFMLADMEILTVSARQMVRYAATLLDHGIVDGEASAIAKTLVGDNAMKVTSDAIQILGGYGYSREYPLEKLLRDAKIYQIFEGTNQIQRMTIINAMMKQTR